MSISGVSVFKLPYDLGDEREDAGRFVTPRLAHLDQSHRLSVLREDKRNFLTLSTTTERRMWRGKPARVGGTTQQNSASLKGLQKSAVLTTTQPPESKTNTNKSSSRKIKGLPNDTPRSGCAITQSQSRSPK